MHTAAQRTRRNGEQGHLLSMVCATPPDKTAPDKHCYHTMCTRKPTCVVNATKRSVGDKGSDVYGVRTIMGRYTVARCWSANTPP
jgi:hypothetical protein